MNQYGFFIDLSRCIGCNACLIACKQWHGLDPGPVKWLRVYQWEKGAFPNLRLHTLPIMCLHCESPVCVKACPHQAIYKEEKFGAVLVDPDKCRGERKCFKACPFGAPQFTSDDPGELMSKCNMCIDRLEQGLKPICVLACSMRALEFGPLEELKEKYGDLRTTEDLPSPHITLPAVVFKETDTKKQLITWDPQRALDLWQHRDSAEGEPLPDLFADASEITDPPSDIVGRNRLVLKPRSSAELMYFTCDDE